MKWQYLHFNALDTHQLFKLLKLRVDVFVVEQQCAYPELDEHDCHPETIHVMAFEQSDLAAYARVIPGIIPKPQTKNYTVRIGRVVVANAYRGTGLSSQLLKNVINLIETQHPYSEQFLSAQEPLVDFYRSFQFTTVSKVYLEDGIPHIDMVRKKR